MCNIQYKFCLLPPLNGYITACFVCCYSVTAVQPAEYTLTYFWSILEYGFFNVT